MRRQILPEELHFFYRKTGEAIWHLQHVESFLCKYYFITAIAKTPGGATEEAAADEMSRLNRQPLGIVIGDIEKAGVASSKLLSQLKSLNKERKWVVHNSNRQDGLSLYTDSGREYFLRRICAFTESAINLQHLISEELLEYGDRVGISRANIEAMSKQQVKELKGEA